MADSGDDAFERAAALFRPEWENEDGALPGDQAAGSGVSRADARAPRASNPGAAAAQAMLLGQAEPSVIVQPDVALVIEGPVGAPLTPASSFGPAGFGSAPQVPVGNVIIGTPSAHARHEATVVTKALPMSTLRSLGFGATSNTAPEDADELAIVGRQPADKKRLLILGGAACVMVGIIIAIATGGSDAPAPAAVAPVTPAPVVQPLPAVVPAAVPAASAGRSSTPPVVQSAKPAPVVSKKPVAVAPVRPAPKPPVAKAVPVAKAAPAKAKLAASKPVVSKAPVAKAPVAKATPAKGKAANAKGGAKGKAQPAEAKKARSPIDVLNPWGT